MTKPKAFQIRTRKQALKYVSYDPETGVFTRVYSLRRFDRVGKPAGWNHPTRHTYVNIRSRLYLAHRLAWLIFYGRWPKAQLDHINGDRYDNRIANLREATNRQNQQNRKKSAACSSKFKGVSWAKRERLWVSHIVVAGKRVGLGYFREEKDAARAYDIAALRHFGAFARPNFGEAHAA